MSKHTFEPLSYAVLGACISVQRQLGVHCMELDYQRALELELPKRGLEFQREAEHIDFRLLRIFATFAFLSCLSWSKRFP